MADLAGKVAIVTGAAGVLGVAQGSHLAKEGCKVVMTDLVVDRGEAIVRDIRSAGGEAIFMRHDVASEDAWRGVIAEAVERFGGLNVLVNNASINMPGGKLEDRTAEEWDKIMAVNAKSVFLGTKFAIPEFRKAGGGSIVNISSLSALGCSHLMEAAYSASKAAVTMFSRVTAVQYGAENIRCNSVHPGPINTDMMLAHYSSQEMRDRRLSLVPLARFGDAAEVASVVTFLASDKSSYMTGSELVVDGGSLAR